MIYIAAFLLSILFSFSLTESYCIFFLLIPIMFIASILLFKKMDKARAHTIHFTTIRSTYTHHYLICFIILLICTLFFWIAYFPGGFNLDAYGQYDQAHGVMHYSDWHPVFSTLILNAIICIMDDFSFVIFVQIILFCLSVTSIIKTLEEQGIAPRRLYFCTLLIGLNPAVGLNTICLTKDVHFTILAVFTTNMLLRLYYSNGKWLTSYWNRIIIGFVLAACTLVRHNGLFFSLPVLVLLLIVYKGNTKLKSIIILSFLLLLFVIKGPITASLHATKHDNVIGEIAGIPMAIMGNALTKSEDQLPNDVHEFLNEIATDDEWKQDYCTGEWDSMKWDYGGIDLLSEMTFFQLFDYTIRTIISCPQAAYESVRANTEIVWGIWTNSCSYWTPYVYIEENDYGIIPDSLDAAYQLINFIRIATQRWPLCIIFWNTGFHLVLLILSSYYCSKKYSLTAQETLLVAPIILYDLGTMLLLAGPNQRYFYFTAVLVYPIVLCFDTERSSESNEKDCNHRGRTNGAHCSL